MEIYQTTVQCFNWCKDQYIIHERNLLIKDQTFIVLALIALVIYNLISLQWDNIISNSEMDENTLEKIHEGLHFTIFIMLIMHLIYIAIR